MKARRYLAFAFLLAAGCSTPLAGSKPDPPPLDWQPQLDQPIRQLRDVLAATEQQQTMNYTSSNLAFVLDAKLYLLFERYLKSLPAQQRSDAIEQQRAWLQKRRLATGQAYLQYEGGTLASFSANQAFIKCTEHRIAELTRQMPSGNPATRPGEMVNAE